MLFAVLTVVTLAGAAFQRTYTRYRAQTDPANWTVAHRIRRPSYPSWLTARLSRLFSLEGVAKLWKWFLNWTARYYPGWMRWIFLAIGLSFLYLAASGFFYGVFVPRGMFGFPLVAHVALGAVFAFGLAFILLWRARDYAFDGGKKDDLGSFACPVFKSLPAALVAKILFWTQATAGLVIILSALFSMLPILPADAQGPLLEIHRYSALVSALAMIVFADAKLIPAKAK